MYLLIDVDRGRSHSSPWSLNVRRLRSLQSAHPDGGHLGSQIPFRHPRTLNAGLLDGEGQRPVPVPQKRLGSVGHMLTAAIEQVRRASNRPRGPVPQATTGTVDSPASNLASLTSSSTMVPLR